MCKYCEGDKPIRENLATRVAGAIRFVRIKKTKWGACLSISVIGLCNGKNQKYLQINYCPMCGRKLEV